MAFINPLAAQQVERLRDQAEAVRFAVTKRRVDSQVTQLSMQASETLNDWANKQERRLKEGAIHEVPPNATDAELREARLRQAVKCGDDFYLPIWKNATVGMPNILLRSELFAAANTSIHHFHRGTTERL